MVTDIDLESAEADERFSRRREAYRKWHLREFGCEPDEADDGVHMIMTDIHPMPFGKHKGVPMQDVPASYLHYLWQNGLKHDLQSPVADYIRRNVEALKKENPDLIWS